MSRQATLALITLVSRGIPASEAVKQLRAQGKAAYEGENPAELTEVAEDAPSEPEAVVTPPEPETAPDGPENEPEPTPDPEPAPEPEPEPEPVVEEATLEIPANWSELPWAELLALAKEVAARMEIQDPSTVKSKDDVNTVMTAAVAALSA
jgi:hypothetical protein